MKTTLILTAAVMMICGCEQASKPQAATANPPMQWRQLPPEPGPGPQVQAAPGAPTNVGGHHFVMHPQEGPKVNYLGAALTPPDEAVRAQLCLPEGAGLMVAGVEDDSPAAKAGLQKFDVLVKLGDQLLVNQAQLGTLIHNAPAGQTVNFCVMHQGKESTVRVTLAQREMPRPMAMPGQPPMPGMPGSHGFGQGQPQGMHNMPGHGPFPGMQGPHGMHQMPGQGMQRGPGSFGRWGMFGQHGMHGGGMGGWGNSPTPWQDGNGMPGMHGNWPGMPGGFGGPGIQNRPGMPGGPMGRGPGGMSGPRWPGAGDDHRGAWGPHEQGEGPRGEGERPHVIAIPEGKEGEGVRIEIREGANGQPDVRVVPPAGQEGRGEHGMSGGWGHQNRDTRPDGPPQRVVNIPAGPEGGALRIEIREGPNHEPDVRVISGPREGESTRPGANPHGRSERPGFETNQAQISEHKEDGATTREFRDNEYSVRVRTDRNGQTTVVARSVRDQKVVFDGSANTPEEISKMPPPVQRRFEQLRRGDNAPTNPQTGTERR